MPIIFNILLTGRVLSLDVADSFTGANMSRPIFGEVCPDTVPLTCIAHFRLEWPENIFWVVCSTPACLTQDGAVDISQNVPASKTQHVSIPSRSNQPRKLNPLFQIFQFWV